MRHSSLLLPTWAVGMQVSGVQGEDAENKPAAGSRRKREEG